VRAAFVSVVFAGLAGACSPEVVSTLAEQSPGASGPVLRDTHLGLEMRVWLAEDDTKLAEAIDGLSGAAPPLSEPWSRSGLRLFSVPVDQLTSIREAIVGGAARQSRWIGQPSDPLRIVQGPEHAPLDLVRTSFGYGPLDRGVPELTARAWIMPLASDAGVAPSLAIELGVTHRMVADRDVFRTALGEHESVTRSLLTFADTLGADEALVLLAYADDDATSAPPPTRPGRAPPLRAPSLNETGPRPGGSPAEGTPTIQTDTAWNVEGLESTEIGPAPPRAPTLGELLMPTLPGPARGQNRKPVLVLIPRLGDAYRVAP